MGPFSLAFPLLTFQGVGATAVRSPWVATLQPKPLGEVNSEEGDGSPKPAVIALAPLRTTYPSVGVKGRI
jgi:hypothetical protein